MTSPKFLLAGELRRSVLVLVCLMTLPLSGQVLSTELSEGNVENDLVSIGHAYDLQSDELLYVETHRIDLDQNEEYKRALVTYQAPEGDLIASKQLDYQPYVLRPQLAFEDKRDPYQIRVLNTPRELAVRAREQGTELNETLTLDEDELVIVDAGFDRMVRRYWERLVAGETIEFEFLALSRASLVSFKVYQTSIGEEHLDLAIAPTNWLIQLLMDPIELHYDLNSRRLMEYRGVTNIRAWESGQLSEDNYHARIRYEYLDKTTLPASGYARHGDSGSGKVKH